jgi:PAS domain S-box-containing protein
MAEGRSPGPEEPVDPATRAMQLPRVMSAAEQLAQMGSWALDFKNGEAVWSDGMYRILGLAPGSVQPGTEVFFERIHPDDRDRARSVLERVIESTDDGPETDLVAEYRAVRADGSVRDVRFLGRVERTDEGVPVRWVGAAHDVTDQRLTERELQAHYALGQALRDWESFDEGVVGLLRRLGTALDYPVGVLWAWDERTNRLVPRAFWEAQGVDANAFEAATRETSFRPGRGVPGVVWETGEPVVTDELDRLSPDRGAAARQAGLRSGLAFAATGDDGPLAVLTFYAPDRRAPSERLLRTLSGIGRQLGRFLSGRRAELGSGRLSERELEVLTLAAEGNTGPQIAERLFVSPATIKTHFEHIYEKLGVGDRAAAVAHALRTGLIR